MFLFVTNTTEIFEDYGTFMPAVYSQMIWGWGEFFVPYLQLFHKFK